METIKDVLCFLNEFHFTDNTHDDVIEKLRCVKRILVIEFEDYEALREIVFYLTSFKHFVNFNENLIEH